MRMISANGRGTEIPHITIWAWGSVPLFSKMAKCASRGALRTSAKCANAPQKERLPPTRPRTNTQVRVNMAFFSMQHCSLTTSNPANYGSIQVVREGYCDPHVMLLIEKLIKNCESTSQILTGWSQNNGNHPGTAVVFLNLLIGNMGKVVRAGCQNYEWKYKRWVKSKGQLGSSCSFFHSYLLPHLTAFSAAFLWSFCKC